MAQTISTEAPAGFDDDLDNIALLREAAVARFDGVLAVNVAHDSDDDGEPVGPLLVRLLLEDDASVSESDWQNLVSGNAQRVAKIKEDRAAEQAASDKAAADRAALVQRIAANRARGGQRTAVQTAAMIDDLALAVEGILSRETK